MSFKVIKREENQKTDENKHLKHFIIIYFSFILFSYRTVLKSCLF